MPNSFRIIGAVGALFLSSCGDPPKQAATVSSDHWKTHDWVAEMGAPQPLAFVSRADFSGATTKLNHGIEVDSWRWPAVLDAKNCTAALIGPRVVVTAAHCVDALDLSNPSAVIPATLVWFGFDIGMECSMNPNYAAASIPIENTVRSPADHALCWLESSVDGIEVPTHQKLGALNLIYETIDASASRTNVNAEVTLSGYGCHDPIVAKVPHPTAPYLYWRGDFARATYDDPRQLRIGPGAITTFDGSTIIFDGDATKEPSLCPGDSGGPLFSGHQAKAPSVADKRALVAVNSTIGIRSHYPVDSATYYDPPTYSFVSSFASLGTPSFESFLKAWLNEPAHASAKICIEGLSGHVAVQRPKNCRVI